MGILEQLEGKGVWEVTELNTRRRRFKNEVNDILYGDNYKKHSFKTKEEAYAKMGELEGRGIKTSIARVVYS